MSEVQSRNLHVNTPSPSPDGSGTVHLGPHSEKQCSNSTGAGVKGNSQKRQTNNTSECIVAAPISADELTAPAHRPVGADTTGLTATSTGELLQHSRAASLPPHPPGSLADLLLQV